MPIDDFNVRLLTREEIQMPLDWAAEEGWNPGLHDAESFFAADPTGYFVGELNGKPVSVISVVKYGDDFAFIGLYIVKPEFRNRGFGLRTWNHAIANLGNRNIGLDAVVEQQKTYERSGFKKAYANIRFGMVAQEKAVRQPVLLSSISWEELLAYDRSLFPSSRNAFLKSWINQPRAIALGILEKDKLAGYGVLRPCRSGYKIGPLFANDANMAENLFQDLISHVPGQTVFLDTPEINPEATNLAARRGMTKVFETGRMYTDGAPELPMHRMFGITTFELG
ncbi:MAG: N-acetyltransferase [Verrucomicrobiales bacterium]|nr:N-acetyltransferase [Verrucomicrobiales bacterium]